MVEQTINNFVKFLKKSDDLYCFNKLNYNNQHKIMMLKIIILTLLLAPILSYGCINYQSGCTQCQPSYILFNKTCLYILQTCSKVNLETGQCQICRTNYTLIAGQCYKDPYCGIVTNSKCDSCVDGYYLLFGLCKKIEFSVENCHQYRQFSDNSSCISCGVGFVLSLNKCIQIPKNCQLYLQTGECVKCQKGYKNTKQFKCIGTHKSDQQCIQPYLIKNGTCILNKTINCLKNNPTNKNCQLCSKGFSISGGACFKGTIIDLNCKQYKKQQCIACYSGFYLQSNRCIEIDLQCKKVTSKGQCSQCYQGYTLNNNLCLNFINNFICLIQSSNYCRLCSPNYIPFNNTCIPKDHFCQSYDLWTGICYKCKFGYIIRHKYCIKLQQIGFIFNPSDQTNVCKSRSGNICFECPVGFYMAIDRCAISDPNCKKQQRNGTCIQCYSGYITDGKSCIIFGLQSLNIPFCQQQVNEICVRCNQGFYVDHGSCEELPAFCLEVDRVTKLCVNCQEGNILENHQCQAPALGFIDQFCNVYQNGFCKACQQNYYLKQFKCTQIHPNCLKFNHQILQCTICKQGTPYFDICA